MTESALTLRQLRFLVALADELNFSRAAETCLVTQPTLSSALKEMEDVLGVTLAERTKRSVLLTPIGQEIARRARTILADVKEIDELAARQRGHLRGDLRLGAIPTVGPFLIPKALPLLRRTHPELRLYLREELTESLLAGLAAGRLDLVLIALPHEIGSVETEPLFEDGYQLATPNDHPLAHRTNVAGSDLAGAELLLLEKGHCLQRHALSAFPDVAVAQDDSFAATSLATLAAMVAEGMGITLLPQLAVDAGGMQASGVALTPLPGARPREVVLAWRKTSPHGDDFRALAEVFRAARAELSAGAVPAAAE
ncbi:LysR substrate-binding domain-containing protein [Amorphus sp. 3PC139-8]|uniref:LysR substrate-binding domain-containing protein n=1 Tax=Amorphus sp. 3PC139-8 TaxID=2735676 RepID=UPI00345DFA3E